MAKKARCVFTLVVAMAGKVGDKFIIGNAAGLGKAIHAFVDLHIDIAIANKGTKVVLVKNGLGDEGYWDHHVLWAGEDGVQVEVLDVHAHEHGVGSGDNAVENEFGCGETSRLGTDISWVVDEVATNSPADPAWLSFLGSVGNDVPEVSSLAALWDLVVSDELDGVGAGGLFVAICKAARFFSTRFFPEFAIGATEEFGVFHFASCVGVDGFERMARVRVDEFEGVGVQGKGSGE